MIPSEDDVKRQVIPRWRTIKATKDAGEFKSVGRESKTDLDRGVSDRLSLQFDLRLTDWREERDLAAAEELVGIAIVCGATDNSDVKAAAEGILKDPKGLAGSKELAVAILNLAAGEQGHDDSDRSADHFDDRRGYDSRSAPLAQTAGCRFLDRRCLGFFFLLDGACSAHAVGD